MTAREPVSYEEAIDAAADAYLAAKIRIETDRLIAASQTEPMAVAS